MSSRSDSCRVVFNWLSLREAAPDCACDAVIGFGHFDLNIPRHCAELRTRGAARTMIFTGGIGAGTADLGRPEADAFKAVLDREYPVAAIPWAIVENRSTNTAENIRFTRRLLEEQYPESAFGRGIRTVLLVANPCRQRRVWLTWRHLLPSIPAYNSPAPGDFETQSRLYAVKGQDIAAQLLGEFERIRDYPAKEWIASCAIPPAVLAAAAALATSSQQ